MIRRRWWSLAGLSAAAAWAVAAAPAGAATTCVGSDAGCFATIQAAVNAAQSGDVIHIGPGVFTGGVRVPKSVQLVGAGAGRTVIRGGGPVLTLGKFEATSEPTIRISGVTVTGGVTHSSLISSHELGHPGVIALGGGIEILPNADFSGGPTVVISDSVITGNHAAAVATVPLGPPCPSGPCPAATSRGGGIDNSGALTLIRSVVSGNTVGGVASDADGAGIASIAGSLTIHASTITGNHAVATVPNGRFAEGGGLFVDGGSSFRLDRSVVSRNSVHLSTRLAAFGSDGNLIDMNANSGGIHIGNDITTVISHVAISDNRVSAVAPFAEPCTFDSALLVNDSPARVSDVLVSGNSVSGFIQKSADLGPCGSAVDFDGGSATVTGLRVIGNRQTTVARAGDAQTNGALSIANFSGHDARWVTISKSIVKGNLATARSSTGPAQVFGAGVFNNALVKATGLTVSGNVALAAAAHGTAQGGGIWNGALLSGPPVRMVLRDSLVTANRLVAHAGITRQGGGIFSTSPLVRINTTVTGNSPG